MDIVEKVIKVIGCIEILANDIKIYTTLVKIHIVFNKNRQTFSYYT